MKPYYQDNHNTLYCQDFRENSLPDESVQMVVTSPPYWGLRKYSGEQELVWGGDKDCQHEWVDSTYVRNNDQTAGIKQRTNAGAIGRDEPIHNDFCSLCGAWRGSFGLEPTPEMYVQHTIEILREIRRVLRKDGVCFWNIGDSYGGTKRGNTESIKNPNVVTQDFIKSTKGTKIKPKDLCLIPFRVAIAAQEDKWWVRSVIIWSKPNPMPESVTDRPTESHEYILMLTKSARYYWDMEAVREASTGQGGPAADFRRETKDHVIPNQSAPQHRLDREPTQDTGGRNLRSVWTFPTQPYPEAHFAVFPEKLPELCIKAATPEVGCCAACGAPWERVLDKKPSAFNIRVRDAKAGRATPEEGYKATQEEIDNYPGNHPDPGYRQTIGWRPTCKCNADKVPSTVLDPFAGASTTLVVAKRLGRNGIGYELSKEYCKLSQKRIEAVTAPFPDLY